MPLPPADATVAGRVLAHHRSRPSAPILHQGTPAHDDLWFVPGPARFRMAACTRRIALQVAPSTGGNTRWDPQAPPTPSTVQPTHPPTAAVLSPSPCTGAVLRCERRPAAGEWEWTRLNSSTAEEEARRNACGKNFTHEREAPTCSGREERQGGEEFLIFSNGPLDRSILRFALESLCLAAQHGEAPRTDRGGYEPGDASPTRGREPGSSFEKDIPL